jgi:DNA-binding IclR family transcriptional regulator
MRCICASNGYEGPLRNYSLVGGLYPAHIGATSKAYFAYLPYAEWHRLLERPLARYTDNSPVDLASLQEEFVKIRERGYAFTSGEYDTEVSALAVPVFVHGDLYGSLTSAAPRMSMPTPDAKIISVLHQAAAAIDRVLGGRSGE